jgi:transcriptional regulator GlxA family with amidase domain
LGDPSFDTLIICSSSRVDLLPTAPVYLSFIRESAKVSRRVASICLGAFVLASAGLLDGRRATTHWALAREFRARFPKVSMDDDRIFVVDGNIWTSAGMTAGVDLALAMVEEDMGRLWLSIIVAPGGSFNILLCLNWSQNPIASKAPWHSPREI